jgi:hypothetical protein
MYSGRKERRGTAALVVKIFCCSTFLLFDRLKPVTVKCIKRENEVFPTGPNTFVDKYADRVTR